MATYRELFEETLKANKLTPFEKEVFEIAADLCFEECWFEVKDILKRADMYEPSVRGVLGSLTQKGLVVAETYDVNGKKYNGLNVVLCGERIEFGSDNYEW